MTQSCSHIWDPAHLQPNIDEVYTLTCLPQGKGWIRALESQRHSLTHTDANEIAFLLDQIMPLFLGVRVDVDEVMLCRRLVLWRARSGL